jgi:hypothetical protein
MVDFMLINLLQSLYFDKEVIEMKVTKNLGMLVLGIWLVLTGLLQVTSIAIPSGDVLMAVLAIAAGALILMKK